MFGVTGIEHQVAIVQDLRLMKQENEALLRQREEDERENARNLAAHKEVIARLEKTLEEEVAVRDRQIYERDRQISELDRQISELDRQNTSRRMELEWLYRWLPLNRLARRLFYGKGLRRRLLKKLGWRL